MLAGAAALTTPAHASVMLTSVTPDGSDFKYTYSGELTSDTGIKAGSKVVIVDFAGYVDDSISASMPDVIARVTKTAPRGLAMSNPGLLDNKDIPDLVFVFKGGNFGKDTTTFDFSGLSAVSTIGTTMPGTFGTVVVNNGEPRSFDLGSVPVPGIPGDPSGVPEPAVWAMMLVGLFGTGAMMRRARDAAPGPLQA
jgi:hypothetical protein